MEEDFNQLNAAEKISAENDFLKMKMMLERGAEFYPVEGAEPIPVNLENQFLKHLMEFEKQFDTHKATTVFDSIGRPEHFKPSGEIGDLQIDQAWSDLSEYLINHGVELSVSSPNVSNRELYRFTVEELFDHEMDDVNIPGMMHGFIYDEFYPDYIYDNTRYALEDCIKSILCKERIEYMPNLAKKVQLNRHLALEEEPLKVIINKFKDSFDKIITDSITAESCVITEDVCTVKGNFKATAVRSGETFKWNNEWEVKFNFNDDHGYWLITAIQIDGIDI